MRQDVCSEILGSPELLLGSLGALVQPTVPIEPAGDASEGLDIGEGLGKAPILPTRVSATAMALTTVAHQIGGASFARETFKALTHSVVSTDGPKRSESVSSGGVRKKGRVVADEDAVTRDSYLAQGAELISAIKALTAPVAAPMRAEPDVPAESELARFCMYALDRSEVDGLVSKMYRLLVVQDFHKLGDLAVLDQDKMVRGYAL